MAKRGVTIIEDTFWYARCACGLVLGAPNTVDACVEKVRTHLLAFHKDTGADVQITSVVQMRPAGTLPATPPYVPEPLATSEMDAAEHEGARLETTVSLAPRSHDPSQ